MNWNEALILILQHIEVGLNLDPNSEYREVINVPPYQCNRYDYGGEEGYRVQIGANDFIEIPLSMLERLFVAAVNNDGKYNNGVFGALYPQQRANHGCHVHVVGKIFSLSGVAVQINNRNYVIQ